MGVYVCGHSVRGREEVESWREWLSSKNDAALPLPLHSPSLSPSGGPVQPQGAAREQEHASSPNRHSAHRTNPKEEVEWGEQCQ